MKLSILLLCTLLLTGCFEIREEVNMKADGSGEIHFVVNMSQSAANLRRYMSMEKVEGYKVPKKEDVEAFLRQVKLTLGNVAGIRDVFTKSDWSSFIFTVSCHFAHTKALNEAISTLSKDAGYFPPEPAAKDNFSYNNSQFKRLFTYPAKPEEFRKLNSTERYVLESAKMISIYSFERSIRQFSNKKAQLSPSGKAIMLQIPIADIARGLASLENTISF
jgi:hypothetical protein